MRRGARSKTKALRYYRAKVLRNYKIKMLNLEPQFSREHAASCPPRCCWICHKPFVGKNKYLKRTDDHVIAKSIGGTFSSGNIRHAHACCNSGRGNSHLTSELAAFLTDRAAVRFSELPRRILERLAER